ncbi:VTT domain-containing protein [[Eubacterium] cellulosolvens]
MFTMASGLFLNPIIVGVYAGLGAAVGELTGYLIGFGGGVLIEDKVEFKPMRRFYAKYGLWTVYIFSAIPFPFDIIGIICGVLRVRPLVFFILTALGKITSRVMLAAVGTQVANIFIGILEGRFDLLAIILILIISAIFTFSISYWKTIVNRDKNATN